MDQSFKALEPKYKIIRCLGEGAFGVVYLAKESDSQTLVALKKIPFTLEKATRCAQKQNAHDNFGTTDGEDFATDANWYAAAKLYREIAALRLCQDQEHIVQLLGVFPADGCVTLTFEFLKYGLNQVLAKWRDEHTETLPGGVIKVWFLHLLRGIRFLHSRCILHRDLKPANLLISCDGVLKVSDFGLARVLPTNEAERSRPLTHQVATRWYRAPELLFGSRSYDTAVDVWACGCVFAELWLGEPLFQGESDIEQISVVAKLLGSPTVQRWPEIQSLPDYNKIQFLELYEKQRFACAFPEVPESAVSLLEKTLAYSSSHRMPVDQLLKQDYFYELPIPTPTSILAEFLEALYSA